MSSEGQLTQGNLRIQANMTDVNVMNVIKSTTFVGIDFGTSTTVVSVIVAKDGGWGCVPMQIEQIDEHGIFTEQSIINTVLSWTQDQLLFGLPAYKLKPKLNAGQDFFSSFKMQLGLNGPTYPRTKLSKAAGRGYVIETARDATEIFFSFLLPAIKKAVARENLPANLKFAVSVPASFQNNQRSELIECLRNNGIDVQAGCLIDEPNAAFLSFLRNFQENKFDEDTKNKILNFLNTRKTNVLVYDFGAGTCDISILSVSLNKDGIKSTNRAISKFTALGGDNIDREIAKRVLIPAMQGIPEEELKESFIEEHALPVLMYTAEQLKIAMVNWIDKIGYKSLGELTFVEHAVQEKEVVVYSNKKQNIRITVPAPTLDMSDFIAIMEEFLGEERSPEFDVNAPITDALSKAKMKAEDLDAVLFIGGSCENPLVRHAVMSMLPEQVIPIIPRDLREHVSCGAALHSLGHHGFNTDFVIPIVSEDIYVVTRGNLIEPIIRASTPVPTVETTLELMVPEDNQSLIELPICRGSIDVLLGTLSLKPNYGRTFKQGERVRLTAQIGNDKLLQITACTDSGSADTKMLNPLSNSQLSIDDQDYLKARQAYNEAILEHGGKHIPRPVLVQLARAAEKIGRYEEVAEINERIYVVYNDNSVLTDVCYYYSRAGKDSFTKRWAKIAADKNPNAVNLYNYAINSGPDKAERIRYLEKSLKLDPNHILALIVLGNTLGSHTDEGAGYLKKAMDLLHRDFLEGYFDEDKCQRLERLAKQFKRDDILEDCRNFMSNLPDDDQAASTFSWQERNLVTIEREKLGK